MSRRVLIVGATGAIGIIFCSAALTAKHNLTIYTRSPSKLPENISSHPNVSIVLGELEDRHALEREFRGGVDVFVCFAGPAPPSKGTPVLDGMKTIVPLLRENHVNRALILSTPAYTAPEDRSAIKWTIPLFLLKMFGGSAYEEMSKMGELVASEPPHELRWTLFRVPNLTNGPEAPVNAGFIGDSISGMSLSRRSIAKWVLEGMEHEEWVGKAPLLLN